MNDNILNFDRDRQPEPDYPFDDYGPYLGGDLRPDALGDFLELVIINDVVVSRELKPIAGTAHEYAARELGRGRPVSPPPTPVPPMPPHHEEVLTWLSLLVGGVDALEALDTAELPDEELDLTGVAPKAHDRLRAIDRELARVAHLLFGREVLTAARRLVVRVVAAHPTFLQGAAGDDVLACAALTAVAKGNDLVGQGRVVPVTLIRTLFNLRSAPNERAQAMVRAVSPQSAYLTGWRRPLLDVPVLGSPDLLVASFRAGIIEARDAAMSLRRATPTTTE